MKSIWLSKTDGDGPPGRIGMIVSLAVLLLVTGLAYALHWSFTIDDAAISFSYARSFSQGYGLGALYPGAPRVAGYSNLLWVILLGAATRLGLETLLASKILGLLFALGTMTVLFLALKPFVINRWLLLGLALLPITLAYSFWSVSGLENALYGFLIVLAVYFLLQEEHNPGRIPLTSALSLTLVGMTRPEGLVYALAGLGYKLIQLILSWRDSSEKRLRLRGLFIWLGVFLLSYGIFKAWHYWYFAALWPNPIYAKAGWYGIELKNVWFKPEGWVYLRSYFRTTAALWMVPALLFGSLLSMKGPQKVFAIFGLAALALPLYTPDWMVNFRFVYPFLPFQTALLVLAADQLWSWITRKSTTPLWLRFTALALAVWFGFGVARFAWANLRLTERQLACGYTVPLAETRCLDGKMYWTMDEVDQKYRELKGFANQLGLVDPLFLIPDIGATSYVQKLRILDLAGLADYQLARLREGSLLKQYIFQEQLPDFIHTHGAWTRRTNLTAYSAFQENYLPVEQGQDDSGVTQGTFVRKDLLVIPVTNSINDSSLCVLAPGLSLVRPGKDINQGVHTAGVDSFWVTSQPQEQDWYLQAHLFNAAGEQISELTEELGYGWLPTSQWQSSELFRQHLRLPENLPAGDYSFALSVIDSVGNPSGTEACTVQFSLPSSNTDQAPILAALQDRPLDTNSVDRAEVISQHEVLLAQAQAAWNDNALQDLLEVVKLAADLRLSGLNGPPVQIQPDWQEFGRSLRRAASQAAAQNDWQQAYLLYRAAALANPNDAWAQHGLVEARQNYLN